MTAPRPVEDAILTALSPVCLASKMLRQLVHEMSTKTSSLRKTDVVPLMLQGSEIEQKTLRPISRKVSSIKAMPLRFISISALILPKTLARFHPFKRFAHLAFNTAITRSLSIPNLYYGLAIKPMIFAVKPMSPGALISFLIAKVRL